jgi:uncharacterized membrane protein
MTDDDRTFGERVSDDISSFGGSWKFIIITGIFFLIWITFNTLAYFEVWHFDAYPYILLNLVLSFIAAFQAPFIMMSQNRAEKKQDTAYRYIFNEIKELVQQDLDTEIEIRTLSTDIKRELEVLKIQHSQLLLALQKAITIHELNRQDIAEILQKVEEE